VLNNKQQTKQNHKSLPKKSHVRGCVCMHCVSVSVCACLGICMSDVCVRVCVCTAALRNYTKVRTSHKSASCIEADCGRTAKGKEKEKEQREGSKVKRS